jgi:septal ring factor EnvC (AmiA/AmiB activator)
MERSASSGTVTLSRCTCVVMTDQEKVGKSMKRCLALVSMFLSGLMLGCASNTDLHTLQEDTSALARLNSAHEQTVEARVQQLRDRVAQFEQSQAETRRDAAQVAAALDTLRSQLQSLRGDIEEVQHEAGSTTRLTAIEARLRDLEQQFGVPSR